MSNPVLQCSDDSHRIIDMIRRVFEIIDPRLMRHGERVAYLADKLYTALPNYDPNSRSALLILSLLHDIGAYKTEEIDNMVQFETTDVWPHAVYGYLFLHNTTRLGSKSEAILYHHAPWNTLQDVDPGNRTFAGIIHLVDRIDVLAQSVSDPNLAILRNKAGTVFNGEFVETFFRLEQEEKLVHALRSGDYVSYIEDALRALSIPDDEIIEYLKMLVYAIDFRSPFTVTHTANTVAISMELGRLFALSPDDMSALELGSFLHDIGKVFMPVRILESPGRLTDAEMAIMHTHVERTDYIIRDFVSEKVCNIAVRHHEKLNGKGYPKGLTAESLSLPERIIAVADVLSALINRRSYKEPFPHEKSLSIIRQMCDAGELAPEVCDMLLKHSDEIIQNIVAWVNPVVAQYETMQQSYVYLRNRAEDPSK